MLTRTGRINSLTRVLRSGALLAPLCLTAATVAPAQQQPPIMQPPIISQPPVTPEQRRKRDVLLDVTPREPTMKKPATVGLPPPRAGRSYDSARNATYLNVPVTLISHTAVKEPKGALRFEGREVTLTFQLAYRGAQTYDLISAYLIVESTAPRAEADKLAGVRQMEINADPYEYAYERLDYQTDPVTPTTPIRQELLKEVIVFKLPPEDLPQLTGAGRLLVKLGPDTYTVKSPQLSELRRTLAAGAGR